MKKDLGQRAAAIYLEQHGNQEYYERWLRKLAVKRTIKNIVIPIVVLIFSIVLLCGLYWSKSKVLSEAINNNYTVYLRGEQIEISSVEDIEEMDAMVYKIDHDEGKIYIRYN